MRKRPPDFGERLTNLRLQYGSQKELAASLGISVRTLRRWENRTDPPAGPTTKFEPQKITRRERYHSERRERVARETVEEARRRGEKRPEVNLNDLLPRSLFGPQVAGKQAVTPHDFPSVVREITDGRTTHVSFVVVGRGEPGRTEVYVLPAGEIGPFLDRNPDAELFEADIESTDWLEWESLYYEAFREALGY